MATSFLQLVKEYKVVIPILQRDYAQGRNTGKVPSIRDNILKALSIAVQANKNPLVLDFVYGYTRMQGDQRVFYPLDGQQRLTTLYLFHWFVATKEGHGAEAAWFLDRFTYETRHSSNIFCAKLVKYQPESFTDSIKQSILNQPWFFAAWINDPTINSMLTMLNDIQHKVINEYKLENIWPLLSGNKPPVVFHILPMEKLGLPDDLYIKMNSRGKELTEFEYFKGHFSDCLTNAKAIEFNEKIDQQWSDLFWNLYKEDSSILDIARSVDAAFLRVFRYLTEMMAVQDADIEDELDEAELVKKVYSQDKNVEFLFLSLDKLAATNKTRPEFFSSVFYIEPNDYAVDKIRLFFDNPATELFNKCADCYDSTQRINRFSIGEQLLLYACIVHLLENTNEFNVRIRKLRNLISNSEDTVRRENLASLLCSVKALIKSGTLDNDSKFNKTQVQEEIQKELFLKQNTGLLDTVYKLEDHHLLQGCIAIFVLSPALTDYAAQYHMIFSKECEYELISRAMLTFGDYSQKMGWSRCFGNRNNSVWRDLFTPSQRRGDFQNTQKFLYELLEYQHQNPVVTLGTVVEDYLARFNEDQFCEKEWRYYFIKYPEFRKHEDGFYYWPDATKPYECIMMRRKTLGGFHWDPFLFAIKENCADSLVNLDNYGAPLIYVKGNITLKIINKNEGFMLEALGEEGKPLLQVAVNAGIISADCISRISQSASGLDMENRIEKGLQLIKELDKL
ncbi:MAG: DUF262 domain-containing protein [Sporomusaceae bacterium]|nr:DUF262 domain-containing protein [Sporomusaceae bacterium]